MALSIKNSEADRLARQLTEITGETLTDAVVRALRERLERESGRRHAPSVRDEVARMQERIAALAPLRQGSDDDLVDYDERGLPR